MDSIAHLDNGSWKTLDVGVNAGGGGKHTTGVKAMNRYQLAPDHEDSYALNQPAG